MENHEHNYDYNFHKFFIYSTKKDIKSDEAFYENFYLNLSDPNQSF